MEKALSLFCNNCNNKTSHRILYKHEYHSEITLLKSDEQIDTVNWEYLVACNGCNHSALYWTNDWVTDDPDSFSETTRVYPKSDAPPESLPDSLCKIYTESSLMFRFSPSTYTVLIRKAIENICRQKRARGNSLREMIDDLTSKGILPGVFSQVGHKIRLLGNIGAHSGKVEIKTEDTIILKDLMSFLIDYLYVVPEKLKLLEKSLNENYGD